jgi:ADP-ribose 1''-phosphate phosphatase
MADFESQAKQREAVQSNVASSPAPTSSKAIDTSTSKPTKLHLTHHFGDLFDAPPNTVLIHACNTQGSWGAGIALAFRNQYPEAYKIYRSYCTRTHDPRSNPVPTGTCLLIPPCETKSSAGKHWIACLFTSARYGRAKDSSAKILVHTRLAMADLLRQIKGVDEKVAGLRMCRINSGKFGVEWARTVEVLEGLQVAEGERSQVEVWTIDED